MLLKSLGSRLNQFASSNFSSAKKRIFQVVGTAIKLSCIAFTWTDAVALLVFLSGMHISMMYLCVIPTYMYTGENVPGVYLDQLKY